MSLPVSHRWVSVHGDEEKMKKPRETMSSRGSLTNKQMDAAVKENSDAKAACIFRTVKAHTV